MAKTLSQIQAEIRKLQAQAESIRKREAALVIVKIKEAIAHYGLSASDLGLAGKARRTMAPARTAGTKRSKSPVKFRDANGNSWTGHGRRPRWFVEALASGKTEADLRA